MANCFNPETGIYTSPRPPVRIPSDPNLSLVAFLFQNNSFSQNDVALIDAETSKTLTYNQHKIEVSKLAHALLRLEINKNDVVLIFAPNSIPFLVSFFAVTAVGAVATTCNPAFTLAELSKQVRDCNPKLVVTVPENLDLIAKLNLPAILLKSPDSANFATKSKIWIYSDLIEASEGVSDLPASTVRQSDVAALFYSSGTTGVSKGVVLTHRNFIAAAGMAAAAEWDVEGKNVALCFLPMFHIYGLSAVVYGRLRRGIAVVVVAKFEVEKTLRCVEKYRVTHMYVVPPAMIALAKRIVVTRYDLSSLRLLKSAAAPLGKDLMEECAKNFPLANIIQGYGMTESCGTISIENSNEGLCPSGSTGKLLPGIEARIIGVDTWKSLPPNEQGEIWLRGPNMTQGYFKNPEATKSTIDDQGWVHTGDLGYFDKKGQLFVVDRLKELIKCYGFQVAPAELEALLISHPGILEAAVIPYQDAKAGEVPIAFVVCSPSSKLIAEDVQKFIAKQVVPYKRIRKVIFVKNIPKLPSGKILRRQLIHEAPSKL